jgi:transcriptional regulator GlxA family with amidase domain
MPVLHALRQVPAGRVVPGHGPVGTPWPAALELEQGYLARLASDVRDSIKRGVAIDEAAHSAGVAERSYRRPFSEYTSRNATVAFVEFEWE